LLFYVLCVERRPLSSIGFRTPKLWDILLAILAGVLLVVGIVVIYSLVFPVLHLQQNAGEMNTLLRYPFWYRFMMVTRAAVAEEILFRGYPIERMEELTGSTLLAGVISWAVFTIAHLSSWGWAQLIVAGFGGVVLTVLYVWRRNLYANMIAHWVADGAGFLAGA
jgi:membrane protease YdiL (CAAX protease family)